MASVLDDISRDTYENNVNAQRIENLGNPTYNEPLSYDQYQKERKKMTTNREATSSGPELDL